MTLYQKTDAVFLPATEEFLAIFNHRFDYIYSERGIQPQWKTESRHPLHNSLIEQASQIYGVRFGTLTNYALIDVDSGSPYHPRQDKLAIDRMVAALEPLGIVASCKITSSYSQGLHIYLPLHGSFNSWEIASAVEALLTAAGFQITKGCLEIFPNVRTAPDQLYAAHRLPMQAGSYVLGPDNDRIGHSHWDFVSTWRWAESRNEVTEKKLRHVLKFYKRRAYSITKKGAKFLQDLDAEIEQGWTGHGQTNVILGRIAMRGRVFGHILEGTEPFKLRQLIKYTVTTAQSLPGYEEWCRHIPEIDRKAEMWARSAMAKYWPYAIGKDDAPTADGEDLRSSNPWNQLQRELARDRIRYACYDLLDQDALPDGVLDRQNALKAYGIGSDTLYTNLELWHPRVVSNERIINQRRAGDDPEDLNVLDRAISSPPKTPTSPSSLLPEKGGDLPLDIQLRRSGPEIIPKVGGDLLPGRTSSADR
jgi:hypothetical protein